MAKQGLFIEAPAVGQVWASVFDPIHSYLVEGVGESGLVYMVLLNRGVRTSTTYEWPVSRWHAFVMRIDLHLESE
jgi:hypothetical protein